MKLIINGIAGRMGENVLKAAINSKMFSYIVGVDKFAEEKNFNIPIFKSIDDISSNDKFDCIIDFSTKDAIYEILPYALKTLTPIVIATTGYSKDDEILILEASKKIPILKSGNMSIGVNALVSLVEQASKMMGDISNIEIIEQHHNQKIDSPSGTALMLANAVKENTRIDNIINGREGILGKRSQKELGIHAIRGGSIVGKHEVLFILDNEVITLKHEAENRMIFANGSIKAALFLAKQKPGLYNMKNIFKL